MQLFNRVIEKWISKYLWSEYFIINKNDKKYNCCYMVTMCPVPNCILINETSNEGGTVRIPIIDKETEAFRDT